MPNASTSRKRFLRVTQEFETSRLEKSLLAVAYERAVPVVSRRPTRRTANAFAQRNPTEVPTEMDFQPSLATERYVA